MACPLRTRVIEKAWWIISHFCILISQNGDQLAWTSSTHLRPGIRPWWLSNLSKTSESSLTSWAWAHFPNWFPHHAWTEQSALSNRVMGVCGFNCNLGQVALAVTCLLRFWQNDWVTWRWNRYQTKSQHLKLTLEKSLLSDQACNFLITSPTLYHWSKSPH